MTTTGGNGRTTFAVVALATLFVVAWTVSLARLLDVHFYDAKYALDQINESHNCVDTTLGNSTAFCEIGSSYYQPKRYVWFLPHALAAFVWWNFYFWQLIPFVRHRYRRFHRYLGRILMVTAAVQVVSGSMLSVTASSAVIKVVSWTLAVAVTYCIVQAWTAARVADYVRHKYWALRLVGYLQTIALQRFFLVLLMATHQAGWYGLYPPFDSDQGGHGASHANVIVRSMFDGSFVLAILTAILVTEWYLLVIPCGGTTTTDTIKNASQTNGFITNTILLLPSDQEMLVSYGAVSSMSAQE